MGKKHYIKKAINIPIYTGKLVIILTNQDEKLPVQTQINSLELYAMSFTNDIDDNRVGFHVVFNAWGMNRINHGVIAHEICHCVDSVMDYHFIESTKINEPRAYITGWITERIYSFLRKKRIKIHYKHG